MEVFSGTSGWAYSWNEGGDLDWYITSSGLNAVELNASFYRFPFKNQVTGWSRKGTGLAWSVKVHRSITHTHRFSAGAFPLWERFHEAFKLLDPFVAFYLFQAHPGLADADALASFAEACSLGERFALELRNPMLLMDDALCSHLQERLTLVSVDSPVARNRIFPGETVYLRMHGREAWYSHVYSDRELGETAGILRDLSPEKVYVFFNNGPTMLDDARRMKNILDSLP